MDTLKTKSNETLISDLKNMVAEERKLRTQILRYLKEVESRQLFSKRGYPSLFAFVTEELGFSEAAAQRRIQTMRLMRDVPEVEEKIESGTLSLSVASQVQSFFRLEDKKRKTAKKARLSSSEKLDLVKKLEGTSRRSCEKKLIQMAPEMKKPKEKTRAITEEETLIQFVADKELMEGIDKLKQLLFHTNPEGKLDKLFKKLVELGLEKWDPEQRQARRERKQIKATKLVLPPAEIEKRSRHIPAATRDKVWARDKGRCQYRDSKSGKVCGSKHGIQLDHIHAFANDGRHELSNLRLLCSNHNNLAARQIFGNHFVDYKIKQGTRTDPSAIASG